MTNKNCKVEVICPLTNSTVENAFGEEVNLFMHCHMRGYDKDGEGKQLHSEYYDKYGAPVDKNSSWTEGYREIEKLLAKHFNISDNKSMDFPLVAGMAGGVHLYKPLHNDKPWSWTGWIPLQKKWLSEGTFFSNRYFLSIRGNEIQNNLWDYHPHDEEDVEVDDMEYSQIEPNDAYRGGYFFEGNPFGRYVHIMSLKDHKDDPSVRRPRRFNFIVHPLAYRDSLNNIPDNGVDAMQWSIINIAKENKFGPNSYWGSKCHALEIFNDFTYSASYAPEVTNTDDPRCYNGTLTQDKYRYWFNTYPLEYAEFLLDSALARGVYLQTLASNDAFYQKLTIFDPKTNCKDQKELIRNMMSDPKGSMLVERLMSMPQVHYDPPMTRSEQQLTEKYAGCTEFDEVKEFLSTRPYRFETVFGYTTLIDTERKLRDFLFDRKIPGSGLDDAEYLALEYLRDGNYFCSTGVYDIFDYSKQDQFIPYVIKNQPNPKSMCNFIDDKMELEFTFARCKEKNARLVWRYTVMTETETKTLESIHGYFKLSTSEKTVLDLNCQYSQKNVKWLYFVAINPDNPMRRVWFNAVQGPAFGEPQVHALDLPNLEHKVFSTKNLAGKIVQDEQLLPLEIHSDNLDFMFPKSTTEKDDLCVYFLQVCPLQQDITIKGKTDNSAKERPPRILQSVHGLFLMHPDNPTRLKLSNSWDKDAVKNEKIYFYEVNATSGTPQEVSPKPAPYFQTVCG